MPWYNFKKQEGRIYDQTIKTAPCQFAHPIMVPEGLSYSRAHTKLYIKRDDFTGFEMSGNKVRKLEYALKQGIESGAEVFITCGGIQSNHARATAAAAARLGKKNTFGS